LLRRLRDREVLLVIAKSQAVFEFDEIRTVRISRTDVDDGSRVARKRIARGIPDVNKSADFARLAKDTEKMEYTAG
jgi:hypothetical protein